MATEENEKPKQIINVQVVQDAAIAGGRYASFTQVGCSDDLITMSFVTVDPVAINEDGSKPAYLVGRFFVTPKHARSLAELLTKHADKCEQRLADERA